MPESSGSASTYSSLQLIRHILRLIRPYRGMFLFSSFMRFLGDIVWLYPAFAFASLITFLTTYKPGDELRRVWIMLGLWAVAAITRSVSQFLSKFFGYRIAERIKQDAIMESVHHLFRLDMAWHERENSGNKIKRITTATDGFNRILRIWYNVIIEVTVNLIAINVIIAQLDGVIVVCLIAFLVTYFVFSRFMIVRAGAASHLVNTQEEKVTGLMFEGVSNIKTVKVMSMVSTLVARLGIDIEELFIRIKRRIFWYQSRGASLSLFAGLFRIGMLAFIVWGISQGHYEVGFLILFNSYFNNLRESIDELSQVSEDFVTAKFSIVRLNDILQEPVTIDLEEGKVSLPKKWEKITVDHVSFAYGDHQILDDISFEIRRGEKVGIVGLSGAGKSTLFKLLLKERENFTGEIRFDDLSIKEIKSHEYFKQVSVVLQDTEVFNFSLRENILMANAKQKTNTKLLKQALETAHISDFVGRLTNGLETVIGEKGIKLSGGERQRLGIARAIFKQPELLLLDEATSHLDLESEEKIQDSLHAFFEHVTAIVIAHRLTTIKAMDRIIVLEGGKILESGSFSELQKKKGRFYELWQKQEL